MFVCVCVCVWWGRCFHSLNPTEAWQKRPARSTTSSALLFCIFCFFFAFSLEPSVIGAFMLSFDAFFFLFVFELWLLEVMSFAAVAVSLSLPFFLLLAPCDEL